jgi:SHS2 domain-containing protein
MRSHKILGHTADVRLLVEGSSMKEIFTAALEGMAEIAAGKGLADAGGKTIRKIEVSSANETLLLIDFLSEILTLSQIGKVIFTAVQFRELTAKTVKADLTGAKVKNFKEDIKAVTYHEAKIKKNARGNYETIIVFDI